MIGMASCFFFFLVIFSHPTILPGCKYVQSPLLVIHVLLRGNVKTPTLIMVSQVLAGGD